MQLILKRSKTLGQNGKEQHTKHSEQASQSTEHFMSPSWLKKSIYSFRDDATEDQTLHPLLKASHGKLQTSLIFANRPEEAISKHLQDRRRTEEFLQAGKFVNNKSQPPDLFFSLVCFSKIWFGPQAGLRFSHVGKHAQKAKVIAATTEHLPNRGAGHQKRKRLQSARRAEAPGTTRQIESK